MYRPILCLLVLCCIPAPYADPGNPAIDAEAHLANAIEALEERARRRIPEELFLRWSREPHTIVLDARSRAKFEVLHVAGAINLPLPDFDANSLARLLPDPRTRILIYCNNNFDGAPDAMPRKSSAVSLNLSTFVTLHEYGYRNVYELEPLIDVAVTRLTLVER